MRSLASAGISQPASKFHSKLRGVSRRRPEKDGFLVPSARRWTATPRRQHLKSSTPPPLHQTRQQEGILDLEKTPFLVNTQNMFLHFSNRLSVQLFVTSSPAPLILLSFVKPNPNSLNLYLLPLGNDTFLLGIPSIPSFLLPVPLYLGPYPWPSFVNTLSGLIPLVIFTLIPLKPISLASARSISF
jgi:hypothetical protein